MTPLPVIAGIYRVTLDWRYGIQLTAHNVLHFDDQAASGSEASLFAALGANLDGNMVETMGNQCSLDGIDIIPLDGVSSSTHHALDGTFTGQQTGEAITQAATIVSQYTGVRGAANRGRVYLPFVAENAQNAGLLTAALRTTQDAAWETFRVAMEADDWPMAQVSYLNAVARAVTSIAVKPVVGTQRRRLNPLR